MKENTVSISLGRTRLPGPVALALLALSPRLRGQTVGLIIKAHITGLDLKKLLAGATELRRLGVLLNQSLRLSRGRVLDVAALNQAAQKVNQLFP